MLKIGLTGGIGSGKSKVSFVLAKLGSYIFDADTEAKKLLNDNENVQKDIISEFGSDVLDYTGKIDVKRHYWSCNRPECPKCAVSAWAVRLTRRAEAILKYASRKLGKAEHIILSLPQDLHVELAKLRAFARKAMLKCSIASSYLP